ncbi:MAG: PIN domain nuclease [Caldilineaceae bacterium]|nr:PIN domain nuclease [Caldilineaceae bacterium]MCY4091730.1 PIN domain nuclease [Caldilineaceae bacterium]MCY4116835.1 PIN domain nuclease [Caldilineaceae bacterium]MDE0071180.1 PIN domain nuclease [Caldilineaceae bacterium]MDE0180521.1 PIN domain nuclease [Caldilineaceae bacterium]
MRWGLLLRVLVTLIFALLGWELGRQLAGVDTLKSLTLSSARIIVPAIVVSGLIGLVAAPWLTFRPAHALRSSLRQIPTVQLMAATVGLAVGLTIAALLAYPLSLLPNPFGTILPFVGVIVMGYLGVTMMVLRHREILTFFRLQTESQNQRDLPKLPLLDKGKGDGFTQTMLLDTSVIIDGRIADVADTGFLWAVLAVPRFILNELQYIADSAEVLRRNRGRRGLEVLDRLQQIENVEIEFLDQDPVEAQHVDEKLVYLGREMGAAIVTNDYNLNRVAKLQGVRVLNINELANAVKSVVLPGEEMSIHVIQEGKEANQGVGYLDDGTMVVVEQGRRSLGAQISVRVTKVLQTNAGRLIFAVPEEVQERRRAFESVR